MINFFIEEIEGYVFALAEEKAIVHEVSEILLELVKRKSSKKLKVINLRVEDEFTLIGHLQKELQNVPSLDGLIITGFDALIEKRGSDMLVEINFSRESLHDLKVPLLFWLSSNSINLVANWAVDLFTQRSMFTQSFEKRIFGSENNELVIKPQIDLELVESGIFQKINLLEYRLRQMNNENFSRTHSDIQVLLPLIDAYIEIGSYEKALKHLKQFEKLQVVAQNKYELGIAYSRRGNKQSKTGEPPQAKIYNI